jgi:rhamnosyltransferase
MNLAATVIVYNPDDTLSENIQSYSPYVAKLYIADNSEYNQSGKIGQAISNYEYIHDGKNDGIAKRLNQVCRLAKDAGFTHLLTMDQDSSFELPTIEKYLNCVSGYPGKENVAVFGVHYENPEWVTDHCNPVPWTHIITSGSIINLSLLEKLGWFDENLFIDMVDFEYCYRAIMKGYKVILFKNILINHQLGATRFLAAEKDRTVKKNTYYAPIRIYYMVRNYLYLKPVYSSNFPVEFAMSRRAVFYRVRSNLVYNKKRWAVFTFVIRAFIDAKRKRLGKYQ